MSDIIENLTTAIEQVSEIIVSQPRLKIFWLGDKFKIPMSYKLAPKFKEFFSFIANSWKEGVLGKFGIRNKRNTFCIFVEYGR
jgi:hypothetical protein